MKHLFCFGMGFSAAALARRLGDGWKVTGTYRSAEAKASLVAAGYGQVPFDGTAALPPGALDGVTHLVSSISPGRDGDPVLTQCTEQIVQHAGQIEWAGYLSTTGVYGDRAGGWVDETSDLTPSTERGRRRLEAENGWLELHTKHGLPVHLFRLAGIYGPGRNQLESVRKGTARRVIKPGQVFSRIHVEDIAGVVAASIARANPGTAYNVCDDDAAPPQDVVMFAAQLLGVEPPPEIDFDEAEMSSMGRSFYAESKRVSNARVKQELGYQLIYPTYREGLKALL
ncbi:MAG: SDR family oxidoreductase [Hyphomicrobiales bacterium]|nr:SDR family oxidoreductase [Hyphomicrobiales bacterium]